MKLYNNAFSKEQIMKKLLLKLDAMSTKLTEISANTKCACDEHKNKNKNINSTKISNIQADVDVGAKYLEYVRLYGFPKDGIWDQALLDSLQYDDYNNECGQ
jgi:hypothetical protein